MNSIHKKKQIAAVLIISGAALFSVFLYGLNFLHLFSWNSLQKPGGGLAVSDPLLETTDKNSDETKAQSFPESEKPSSREVISSEKISFGEYHAYSKETAGKNYVILEKNGIETVVDEGDARYDERYSNLTSVKQFSDVRFSPKGNYVLYATIGWEWRATYIYDISQGKRVSVPMGEQSVHMIEFTPDEMFVYACSSESMASISSGGVYSIPDFDMKFDLSSYLKLGNESSYLGEVTASRVTCSYDKGTESVVFKVFDDNSMEDAKRVVFSTGKETISIEN
jgi:hypothetical protein